MPGLFPDVNKARSLLFPPQIIAFFKPYPKISGQPNVHAAAGKAQRKNGRETGQKSSYIPLSLQAGGANQIFGKEKSKPRAKKKGSNASLL